MLCCRPSHLRSNVSLSKALLSPFTRLSLSLIAFCHLKKIQYCFVYVHFGILSDPCELNVSWSGKIQQLMMCSTAEEECTFCLVLFLLSFCSDYSWYLSFILFATERKFLDVPDSILVVTVELIILAALETN